MRPLLQVVTVTVLICPYHLTISTCSFLVEPEVIFRVGLGVIFVLKSPKPVTPPSKEKKFKFIHYIIASLPKV